MTDSTSEGTAETALETRRCYVTHNPCGTDTWAHNRPCNCGECQAWLCERLRAAEEQHRTIFSAEQAQIEAPLLARIKELEEQREKQFYMTQETQNALQAKVHELEETLSLIPAHRNYLELRLRIKELEERLAEAEAGGINKALHEQVKLYQARSREYLETCRANVKELKERLANLTERLRVKAMSEGAYADMAQAARKELATERAAREGAERALRALVDVVDAATPAINGCISNANIHGVGYHGPSWAEQLARARAALEQAGREG